MLLLEPTCVGKFSAKNIQKLKRNKTGGINIVFVPVSY
jgi:hypothetical protein